MLYRFIGTRRRPIKMTNPPSTVFATICLAAIAIAAEPATKASDDTSGVKPFMACGASATSKELVAVRFDPTDGGLTAKIVQREPLGFEAAPVVYRNKLLYVASLRAADNSTNRLAIFRVNNGRLARANDFDMNHGSAYLSIDRTGRFLLGVSYFEGHADVYRLNNSGMPAGHVAAVFEGRDKAHSILTSPDNRFVYIPYVKDNNAMFQYEFDDKTGHLQALDPPQAEIPAGIGPRHVAFHPMLPFVYFSNEQHLGVTAFRIAKGGQLQRGSICNPGTLKPADGIAASDITITPDGRFVFVGVRDFAKGQVDAIHRYAVQQDGTLNHLGETPADAIPWGLQISPDHNFLLVTAARGGSLTAFRIDNEGGLQEAASLPWGDMIRAIAVTDLPNQ